MQFSQDLSTFSTISAQERDGEEAVGAKKGHFSAEEIFVGATKHPHSPGDINNDVTQPLPSDVSIGKRPLMLIVAANQESPSRQIT
jgi:hypothetical protein